MNKLKKIEELIKRKPLAEAIGTNTTYLSVLTEKKLTLEMEQRLKIAVKELIRQLRTILKEKED